MQYFGFDRPSFGIKTFGFGANFDPLDLFAGGKQGVWYDPSDKSTLFQDVAGTVPVTTDGDPVALMRDKSGNGNHAAQSVSTSRPVYKTDGNLHWLYFDGADDSLSSNFAIPSNDNLLRVISAYTSATKFHTLMDDYSYPDNKAIKLHDLNKVRVDNHTSLPYTVDFNYLNKPLVISALFANNTITVRVNELYNNFSSPELNTNTTGVVIFSSKSTDPFFKALGNFYGAIQVSGATTSDAISAHKYLGLYAGVTL